jgi:hypothetical protein
MALEKTSNNNVLRDVCRSRRERQTGEDVLPDIFEVTPATVANPFVISIENRFSISFFSLWLIRDLYRVKKIEILKILILVFIPD